MRAAMIASVVLLAALLAVGCNNNDDDPPAGTTVAPTIATTPTATATADATATVPPVALSDCAVRFPAGLTVGNAVDEKFACIDAPLPGASVDPQRLTVGGYSAGSFESNVVIDVTDADGNLLAQQPTISRQPEIGLFVGDWSESIELDAAPAPGTAGTIRAYATSPRDGSLDFAASIAVTFAAPGGAAAE